MAEEAVEGDELFKLSDVIMTVIPKTMYFKSKLTKMHVIITNLKPFFKEIEKLNIDPEDLRNLKHAEDLVRKCGDIKSWEFFKKYRYSSKLDDLNELLIQIDSQLARNKIEAPLALTERSMNKTKPSERVYETPTHDGQDGLLPKENGDVVLRKEPKPEADVLEDYESHDEIKKLETKVSVVSDEADNVHRKNSVNSVVGSDGVGKQNVMSRPKEWQHLQKSLKEIEIATQNFQDCIGKGGFGQVYKGTLFKSGNSIPVAVKRLNEQFGQGLKEFLTEVHLLSGLKHKNVISLLGYCEDGNEKILVYEYAERGSLAQYLRRSNTTYTFTWLERLKICVDAARGLNYLHSHGKEHVTIIHRDIKSANILLDNNWVAKIADFGLSKLTSGDLNRSFVISHACGTPGYCEPEYIITGIVKKESDIYSFGMVLFEVLCGRLCTYRDDDGFLLSCPLAKKHFEQKKLDKIVDPSLREQLNSDSMKKFSAIAYGCLHTDRKQRPPMNHVLKKLEELLKIQEQRVKQL